MAVIRAGFADLYTSRLALLDKVILDRAMQEDSIVPLVFKVTDGSGPFVQTTTVGGFPQVPEKDELDDVSMEDPLAGLDVKYTPLTYEMGYKVSEEAISDDMDGFVSDLAAQLGISFSDTYEVDHANVFNNGFSNSFADGADGIELFSTVHVLLGAADTGKNELTTSADLTVTSLQQALVDFRDITDERGLKRRRRPNLMLVPFELSFKAEELLGSQLSPEDANNAINTLKGTLSWRSWEYLTDTDAWFIMAPGGPGYNIRSYWWQRPETRHDIDFLASAAMTKIRARFIRGWSDWRDVFGSPGA